MAKLRFGRTAPTRALAPTRRGLPGALPFDVTLPGLVACPAGSSEAVQAHRTTLRDKLVSMGCSPELIIGTASTLASARILVGTYAQATALPDWATPAASALARFDQGWLISSGDRLLVLGADECGVENTVWHLLRLLGHRQFAPHAVWEHVPQLDAGTSLSIQVGLRYKAKYVSGIGQGGGRMPWTAQAQNQWDARNGIRRPLAYPFGHAWQALVTHPDYKPLFDANSGWMSPGGRKLTVTIPGVQEAAVGWAKSNARSKTDNGSVSLAATDGSAGWDDPCQDTDLGLTPSDRQVTLANVVQTALNADASIPKRRVAIQAYGDCSPPPSPEVPLHPDLLVVAPMGYIKGGLTWDQVVEGYIEAGARTIWPYSYLSVFTWYRDLPGSSRVADKAKVLQDLARTFRVDEATPGYTCEASPSWAPHGLGYWILATMLTEGSVSPGRYDQLYEEFLETAFSGIVEEARAFYALLYNVAAPPTLSTDLIRKLYVACQNMLANAFSQPVRARVLHLISYVRWLDYYNRFNVADDAERLDAYDQLHEWAYRIRKLDMIHWYMMFYDPGAGLAAMRSSLEARHGVNFGSPHGPDKNKPASWSAAEPGEAELIQVLANGIDENPEAPFAVVAFDYQEPVKPTGAGVIFATGSRPRGNFTTMWRTHRWVLIPNSAAFVFTTSNNTSGTGVAAYVRLLDWLDGSTVLPEITVDKASGTTNRTFTGLVAGRCYLFEVEILANTAVRWSADAAAVSVLQEWTKPVFGGTHGLYFYVPKGTTVVGGWWQAAGIEIRDATDTIRATSVANEGFFSVPVPAGQDGKVWRISRASQTMVLLTVPQWTALSPGELLIPKAVAVADELEFEEPS